MPTPAAGAGPAGAAGRQPRQPRPHEPPHRGPDQRADDDVARVVHAGVDPGVADRAGEQQQRRGGRGLALGHRGGEREGGRGVPGRERRRVRHRYATVGRHARCVPVGPRAAGRELEPDVDQRRVQPHRHEPGDCGTPARAATHRRHRGRDPEPELGPVGGVGEPAHRPVQRRRRGLGDRPIDRCVQQAQLLQRADRGGPRRRPSRWRAHGQPVGQPRLDRRRLPGDLPCAHRFLLFPVGAPKGAATRRPLLRRRSVCGFCAHPRPGGRSRRPTRLGFFSSRRQVRGLRCANPRTESRSCGLDAQAADQPAGRTGVCERPPSRPSPTFCVASSSGGSQNG